MATQAYSIVEYYGNEGKHKCGYCKGNECSDSTGMMAHFMSVADYQALMDRGWRRSGQYCYKPRNNLTCCPSYTIRCDAINFKLHKSHKKILKRMNTFLKDGVRDKDDGAKRTGEASKPSDKVEQESSLDKEYLLGKTKAIEPLKMDQIDCPMTVGDSGKEAAGTTSTTTIAPSPSPAPPRGTVKKAKVLRLERRKAKMAEKGDAPAVCVKKPKNPEKSLEDLLQEEPTDGVHKLKVKLVPSKEASTDASYDLYCKYQKAIHHDPPSKLQRRNFVRFLCTSPLKSQKVGDLIMGSFHQQYWLDDKLIAVGVIDILPSCVSSVYFFYDPDYQFLSLGTYGSLRELDFVHHLYRSDKQLRYYYMGFYIHSCPKMRYKARLTPSYLLCSEAFTWHLITEQLLHKLDANKYARFNEDANAVDEDKASPADIKMIPIYSNKGRPLTLTEYLPLTNNKSLFTQALAYANVVGAPCARRMFLYLDEQSGCH